MPKKLKVSSNERVDLVDFNRAASDYTADSDNFHRKNLWLSKYSNVLKGFRIEVSDQSSNPGEFTIYNGVAVDRDGAVLNNEDQVADSRTITLTGTNSQFYIEVEFTESESDVDVRAFWDPTYTGNTPSGREFAQNVSTRISPDWRVSTPISTTEFDVDSDVNSAKIPVAVLYTNGSNEIVGFTAVNAATVLERDAAAPDTTLRVVDSTIFPDSGNINVGSTSAAFTANDRVNGILTLSIALGAAEKAGAVVVETGPTAAFLPESSEAAPAAPGAATSGDQRRGLFKGHEIRGSALSADPEDSASRSDKQISSLKDYVDFLAAQIRELKFGSLRDDETSTLPPSTFTSTRHYDAAGSVTGARTVSITIGDGTNSFGDLNSSSLGTVLQQAHDALDSTSGGSVFIKAGSYVFNSTVNTDRPFYVEFEEGVVFSAGSYTSTFIEPLDSDKVTVIGAPDAFSVAGAYSLVYSLATPNAIYEMRNCYIGALSVASGAEITLTDCIVTGTSALPPVTLPSTTPVSSLTVKNSTIRYSGAASVSTSMVSGTLTNCTFEGCEFDSALDAVGGAGMYVNHTDADALSNFSIINCSFSSTQTSAIRTPFDLLCAGIQNVVIKGCDITASWSGTISTDKHRTLIWVESTSSDVNNLRIEDCNFSGVGAISGTTEANPGRLISLVTTTTNAMEGHIVIRNNVFGDEPTWLSHFVRQVFIDMEGRQDHDANILVYGNSFFNFTTGVYVEEGNVSIVNNNFTTVPSSPTSNVVGIETNASNIKLISIDSNSFRFAGTMDASRFAAAIYAEGELSVTNNEANLTTLGNEVLFFTDTGFITSLLMTGNRIWLQAEGVGNDNIGIRCAAGISYSTISNNVLTLVGNGSIGDSVFGMHLTGADNVSISGNRIYADAVEDMTLRFIYLDDCQNCTVSSNSVNMGSPTDDVIGVFIDGGSHNIVSSNTVNLPTTINTTTDVGYGIAIFTNSAIPADHNSIVGNTVKYGGRILSGIIFNGNSLATMLGNVISGNTIEDSSIASGLLASRGIRFVTTSSAAGNASVSITGNTYKEVAQGASSDSVRSGIHVDGAGDPGSIVASITANNITGTAVGVDRTADNTGAIFAEGCSFLTVSGNLITGWATSSTDGPCIVLDAVVNNAVVTGNLCDPEQVTITAWPNWISNNANDNILWHGNQSIGASTASILGASVTLADNKIS